MFRHLQSKLRGSVATAAALGVLLPAALGLSSPASSATRIPLSQRFANSPQVNAQTAYTFTTIDDPADPTFNQLLGINDAGAISGYFGSGAAGHPNQGYLIRQNTFINENYPGSIQTQVTALNNHADTAGFWVDAKGNNFGFVEWNGVFTSYRDPNTGKGTVNQILSLNDAGLAVGFYTDGKGVNHGFVLNQASGKFVELKVPGGTNVTLTGINDTNDITGFMTAGNGAVIGFLLKNNKYSAFAFPNATTTMPFGINRYDEIVGAYIDASGATHGFTLTTPLSHATFTKIDDPNGVGNTFVNGVNDYGALVGFYLDAAGNTDGFFAKKP